MSRTSKIDPSKPTSPHARTSHVRENFGYAKQELEELFSIIDALNVTNAPAFSGEMTGDSAVFSLDVSARQFLPTAGKLFQFMVANDTIAPTAPTAGTSISARIVKISTKMWLLTGNIANTSGGNLVASGTIWMRFAGTLDATVTQVLPALMWNSATELDGCFMLPTQAGGNVDIRMFVREAGAEIPVPNGANISFNSILWMA